MDNLQKTRLKNKTKPISRRRHNYAYLLLAILFSIILTYLVVNTSPNQPLAIKSIEIPTRPLFLLSILGLLYSAFTFLLIKKIQGVLIAGFTTLYILLRFIGLTHWIFLILFIALFVTTETFLLKKK